MSKQYNNLVQLDKSNHIKRLTISTLDSELVLDLHCHSYDLSMIQLIQEIYQNKKLTKTVRTYSADHCYFILTEIALVELVDFLSLYGFEIDPIILDHYQTIKSWNQFDVKSKYQIDTIPNNQFFQLINQEIFPNEITQNIIKDRRIRYQYFVDKSKYDENNLTEQIANRSQSKIWIDNKKFSIENIIDSIVELHRTPILFVFNQYTPEQSLEYLKIIESAIEKHEITELGVYFRLPNTQSDYRQFNTYLANKNYNNWLIENTKIAVIQDGKIPKFMFKTTWIPMTIILLDTGLKQNKTMAYAQDKCDLIIEYSETSPIQLEQDTKRLLWK